MAYIVHEHRRVTKGLKKLPKEVQQLYANLLLDLEETGPVQTSWPNYSKLSKDKYHCHLNYHYSACWTCEGQTITIEVYYVGTREGAPY